jgi:hypothetical protein
MGYIIIKPHQFTLVVVLVASEMCGSTQGEKEPCPRVNNNINNHTAVVRIPNTNLAPFAVL